MTTSHTKEQKGNNYTAPGTQLSLWKQLLMRVRGSWWPSGQNDRSLCTASLPTDELVLSILELLQLQAGTSQNCIGARLRTACPALTLQGRKHRRLPWRQLPAWFQACLCTSRGAVPQLEPGSDTCPRASYCLELQLHPSTCEIKRPSVENKENTKLSC